MLDSLGRDGLRGGEAEAKFALLYSMALDKNWMDVADDSLINVAVRRYSRRGSADERLKAYYYQGCVYQNGGDDEAAMESFVKAEASAPDAEDGVAKGMLCYRKAGDIDKYTGALKLLAGIYASVSQFDKAEACLDSMRLLLPDISMNRKNEYYIQSMRLKRLVGDREGLAGMLDEYLTEVDSADVEWLDIVDYETYFGDYDSAEDILLKYRKHNLYYKNDPVYYIRACQLYESLQDYKTALECNKQYEVLMDSLNLAIVNHDTGFMKERYEKELRLEKARSSRTVIVLVAVFGMLLLLYVVYMLRGRLRRKNAEAASYRENLSRLNQEKEELSAMIADNPPVDRQSMKVLCGRLELLNRILAAEISPGYERNRKVDKELEQLVANREEFLYATRMTFAAAHPRFITALESRGLTEAEVEYCCLYAIGLRGKDISVYVGHGGHYNESSAIRSKLGLGPHDTNLGNYLRSML